MMVADNDGDRPVLTVDGRTFLVVGYGGPPKARHYVDIRSWSARLVMVCGPEDMPPPVVYDELIRIHELTEHVKDEQHAAEVVARLASLELSVDGVFTLWEDCGPLAARIAHDLGLAGVPIRAAAAAKSKLHTQDCLLAISGGDKGAMRYAVKTHSCNTLSALDDALEDLGLPAVLKLEYGSSAVGVASVASQPEAIRTWTQISRALQREDDCTGVGLGFGSSLIVSEQLDGTEHDIDLVMWRGQPVATFMTDNGPTRLPSYAESSALMPSVANQDDQLQCVEAATTVCRHLGLHSGVFNLELILTSAGPKIIDVNARMGGFYIRDWIKKLWGYDLLHSVLLCALDVPPPRLATHPEGFIAGAMLLPSTHGTVRGGDLQRRYRELAGRKAGPIVTVFEESSATPTHHFIDEPWGNLAVYAESPSAAIAALIHTWDSTGLAAVDPQIADYLPLPNGRSL